MNEINNKMNERDYLIDSVAWHVEDKAIKIR